MIHGAHVLLFSRDAEADRAFLRDILGFRAVDAGAGWLILELPPAEVAVHPDDEPSNHRQGMLRASLYLMCDDVRATIEELKSKDVACAPLAEQRWGILTTIRLPGGGDLGLYQPKHPLAKIGQTASPADRGA